MDMIVITQLCCQLYVLHYMSITCFGQYYFWPTSGWIQLSEKTTQYNMTQTLMVILYRIIYCVVFSDNCIQRDDGQK